MEESNQGRTVIVTVLLFPRETPGSAPALVHNITGYTSGTPGTTTITLLDFIRPAFYAITGALTVTLLAGNKETVTLQFAAGTSWDGTTGNLSCFRLGPGVIALLDSRL